MESFENLAEALMKRIDSPDGHKKAFMVFCLTYMTMCHKSKIKGFDSMQKFLKQWIQSDKIVGGSMFGGGFKYYQGHWLKELKVCIVFCVTCLCDLLFT